MPGTMPAGGLALHLKYASDMMAFFDLLADAHIVDKPCLELHRLSFFVFRHPLKGRWGSKISLS